MENYSVMLSPIVEQIVQYIHIDKNVLIMKGIQSFLKEKKKNLMFERLNILSRYNVTSKEQLETGIENGTIQEHPSWEDLIFIENLESESEQIDEYLRNL
jgi:hypothetical protein